MNPSPTMTAAVADTVGAPLRITQLARPQAGPGQVLVRIAASAVNPLDTKILAGQAAHARQPLPSILGIDLAGTVVALGAGVSGFQPGDAVYAMAGGVGGVPGALAEYAAVDAELLALKPAALDMRQAAALPLVTITAWKGLVDRARLQAGQSVLVHGGAGGVGHVAVQIALARGARVFATGSAADQAYIRNLGATPIDYRAQTVEPYVAEHTAGQGFDVVYDTVGGATLDASFAAVRRFGQVVSCLGWGTHALAPLSFRAASYSGVFTLLPLLTGEGRSAHGAILREASRLADAGQLRPRLDPQRFPLEQVNAAYQAVATGHSAGKIVLDLA